MTCTVCNKAWHCGVMRKKMREGEGDKEMEKCKDSMGKTPARREELRRWMKEAEEKNQGHDQRRE